MDIVEQIEAIQTGAQNHPNVPIKIVKAYVKPSYNVLRGQAFGLSRYGFRAAEQPSVSRLFESIPF